MLELSSSIELIAALLIYFLVHFSIISILIQKRKLNYLFYKSIIFLNIIALTLVLIRLITLTIPEIPFFEQYILKAVYLPLKALLPAKINPFLRLKTVPTFTALMVHTLCTVLLFYHVLTQLFFLRLKNFTNIFVVIISSLGGYIATIIGIITIHHLIKLICFC